MGYQTRYSLNLIRKQYSLSYIIQELRQLIPDAREALDFDGNTDSLIKWYEHETDLIEFSKKHPDIIFTLNGVGEDHDDIWRKYFKNGRVQVSNAKITFDECNL